MNKKKRLKITPVLIALNIIVLLFIISFYTTRLVKYYLKENGTKKGNDVVLLSNEILKHQSYLDLTKGLVYDEENNNYKYKGKVNDNYVLYSGMLYRIVGIDNENNIKLVSEDNITMLYSGLNNGYEKSYVNKWLNKTDAKNTGIYENALVNSENLLTYTYLCDDKIDDVKNITCENYYTDSKITLLSLYDYKEAGGASSYLNNGHEFALATLNSNNNDYFVGTTGEIGLNERTTKTINVRPVITIKEDTILLNGDGTKEKPYVIESHEVKTLKDVYVNNIIKIDDNNYKVIEVNDDYVKVAALDVLKDKEDNLKIAFSSSSSEFTTSNTVGKYLNNTFYNSLESKDLLVSGPWYVGSLSLDNLDYTSVYSKKVNSKVGMLTLADFYVGDLNNIFTLSRGIEGSNIINVINKDGNIFADTTSSKYNVRVSFYLDSNINIESGSGNTTSPYVLGVKNETKE